ncbi:6-phosphogluconolactonase [Pseudoteredinibacter isoporae]|uniref:6-phosphogluconolactonase n=1 Tax=Pseudoteredinibacter isoporae TaxID=570281 RepID=A0A7X0JPS5_9GAMM|nr:6-phosphogluconolactonase [Pseudoteredinibacter isoporae]NHO85634.1 6-phosphogluconolactonase [Pseudoteredinibacter isoporae]NIB25914.1 6-phosphogluconolactonase [Pseudoteredinibacter isoporae]
MVIESFFDSKPEMLSAVQAHLLQSIESAQQKYGNALLALSGGSSPKPLYESLAQQDLDWSRTRIALVDERWVDKDHPASNEAFIERCFSSGACQGLNIAGLKNQAKSAAAGLAAAEEQYRRLGRAFDFALLGMGTDGHTASWFPRADGLDDALSSQTNDQQLLCVVHARQSEVTGPYTERMTLNKHAVLNSSTVALMISGQEKFDVYQTAKNAAVQDHPVAALLQQQEKDIHVFYAP